MGNFQIIFGCFSTLGGCFLAGQAVLMHPCKISSPSESSLDVSSCSSSTVRADKLVLELDLDIQLGVPSTQNFFTSSQPISEGVAEEKIKALCELLELAGAGDGLEADLTGIPEREALFMLLPLGLEIEQKHVFCHLLFRLFINSDQSVLDVV